MLASAIRENVNGALLPLSFILAVIIAIYLYRAFLEFGPHDWRHQPGAGTACILFWIFVAEAVRSAGAWMVLRVASMGFDNSRVLQWTTMAYIIAGSVLLASMLRCTFFFTPPRWGNRVWILSASITAAFLLGSYFLKQFGI